MVGDLHTRSENFAVPVMPSSAVKSTEVETSVAQLHQRGSDSSAFIDDQHDYAYVHDGHDYLKLAIQLLSYEEEARRLRGRNNGNDYFAVCEQAHQLEDSAEEVSGVVPT